MVMEKQGLEVDSEVEILYQQKVGTGFE